MGDAMSLPRYVELPHIDIERTGDVRNDILAAINSMACEVASRAERTALDTVFRPGGTFGAGHPDPIKLAVAADTLRQLAVIVDGY